MRHGNSSAEARPTLCVMFHVDRSLLRCGEPFQMDWGGPQLTQTIVWQMAAKGDPGRLS